MDAHDVDKEEFISLRSESQFHQVNASAIFALNVTVLGIAVGVASTDSPVALPFVALLGSILWARYLDHLVAIFRVSAYVSCVLRPRFRTIDLEVFGWEEFIRTGDPRAAGEPNFRAQVKVWLVGSEPPNLGRQRDGTVRLPAIHVDSRRGIDVAGIAFLAPPPFLIAWYVYHWSTSPLSGFQQGLSIGLTALGVLAWYLALVRTRLTRRRIGEIDDMIVGRGGQDSARGSSD